MGKAISKHDKRVKGSKATVELISDEMVENHLQGKITIRAIAEKIKKSISTVHEVLADKIAEFNKCHRSYALARAEYSALRNITELLNEKVSKDHLRKDLSLKVLEGLGILNSGDKDLGTITVKYVSHLGKGK